MPDPSPEIVEALFQKVIDLDPEQRRAFLDKHCAADLDLRSAVEELLHFDAKAQSAPDFLLSLAPDIRPALPTPAAVPESIGMYRVIRLVGEGGMGTVYEAEQDDLRRTVALKVMRLGLDSPELRKRFVHEAHILSRLHHAGIARVYDVGATEDGRLYYAMEFIRGVPLGEFARLRNLAPATRLELLARVCEAVQHAHEQGIIHRDLKPANILVEDTGQPKVLDFGVAHATGGGVLGSTAHTRTGQMIGTLGYMSPEQVAGNPRAIDARSDVYALGVILYELLADRLPYQVNHLPIPEVVRVIQEVEPSRLGSVNRQFRGEIETIVAKALEKDKARRYPSAGELGKDLRRHLAHEPIQARPPSALYQLRKFSRRHKALVGGVVAVTATLILGLIGMFLFAVREADQRRRAERNAQAANDEKETALHQAYRARLAAAAAALQNHDVADAARQLDDAPESLRSWEWQHLHSRLNDRAGQLTGEQGTTFYLFRRPDGIQVAHFIPETSLRLTDLDGRRLRTILFNTDAKAQVAGVIPFTDDLRFLEWERSEVPPHVWDEAAASRFRLVRNANSRLSPDGSHLAVSYNYGNRAEIWLYETASGRRLAICDVHKDQIFTMSFSPESSRLTSADEGGFVCVWEAATGAKIASWRGHASKILSVRFRPDGARLATASADGTVRQWDPATGRELEPPHDRHSGEVLAAVYSPDGEWVASGGTDRTIRLWRATGRQEVAVLHGHTGAVTDLAFAPDGRRLASVSQDLGQGWSGDHTVGVWDVDFRAGLPVLRGHTSYVYPVAFSPDGRWIASGSWDHTVRLWDAATGEHCATLPHPGVVLSLAFGPDGSWLVSGGAEDDKLRIWDVATARLRREIQAPGKMIRFLAVSPDGTRIAATAYDAQDHLGIYDQSSGKQLFLGAGAALAYSPDGRWLATRSAEGKTLVLMDAKTHQVAARLSGHADLIRSATFSPDDRLLASCSNDRTLRLWEMDALTLPSLPGEGGEGMVRGRRILRGHTDEVLAVSFHPDGTRLASAGKDRSVWLWDLTRDEEVARLPGHTDYIWSLAFSPDGKTLVSGSGDGTVRLWDTFPLEQHHHARREAEALRPDAERLVARLLDELHDPDLVVKRLRDNKNLDEAQRHAAIRAVLHRQRASGSGTH